MLLQLHVISFHVSIFYKTQKKLSRPDFGLFWVQKPKNRIFSKDVLHHFFKLDDTLTSRKKKTKLLRAIPEKNSGKTEKRTEGISLDLHFVGPR